jgi:hypothetical protein
MFRLVIKLLVVGLVLHAAYRVVPPFWSHFQLRDAVQEMTTHADTPSFSGRRLTPDQMRDKFAKLAQDLSVPLDRDDFEIKGDKKATVVEARYIVQLEYLPRQYYPYEFVIYADGGPSRYRAMTP